MQHYEFVSMSTMKATFPLLILEWKLFDETKRHKHLYTLSNTLIRDPKGSGKITVHVLLKITSSLCLKPCERLIKTLTKKLKCNNEYACDITSTIETQTKDAHKN